MRRLTLTRDPLGRAIQQQWCGCGTLDALVDGNGNKTSWERDVRARVMREIRTDGSDTDYVYETTTSRLKSVTDAKNQVTTYGYFLDDQLQHVAYTNDTPSTPDESFTYDTPYGRMATMLDGIGTTTYGYHPVGQLGALRVATIDAPGTNDTLTYGYDQLGRVVSRALNGVAATWQYDALGRLTTEGTLLGNFTFTYDGASARLASSTYPNNQTSAYTYLGNAGDRRLQTIHHKYPSGATLSKFDYTYNAVGNIVTWRQQADATAVLWQYGYDAADQLISAVKKSTDPTPVVLKRYGYTYDAGGNRRSEQIDDVVTGATYDSRNRLLAHSAAGPLRIAGTLNEPGTVMIDGQPAVVDAANAFEGTKTVSAGTNTFTVVANDSSGNSASRSYQVPTTGSSRTFSHDANGNLTSDGTRTFEWDAVNRLLAVNIGTHRSEFTYDGLSRRTRIVEKENGATVRDASVFWAGTAIIEERLTTGEVNRFFADGEQHNGLARYLTRDHLGSIREVTDASGTVVTRNDYDPYGRSTRVAGTEDSRFGYTGHLNHTPSGLVLALYRAYDPALGRWLSEDPAGHVDGPNMSAYVANNPARYMDPLGLKVGDWWDIVSNLQRAHQIGMEELAKRSGPGMRNNVEDAMRHAEWMRRTAEETNALTAWLAGLGHELENLTEGAPLNEILMDLHNNAQGRRAGGEGRPVDPNSLQTIGGPDKPYNRPKPGPKGYDSYPKSAEGSCSR